MNTNLAGLLTIGSLCAAVVFAAVAGVYVNRLLRRPASPAREGIRGATTVLAKVRHRQFLTADEVDFAAELIADRRAPAAYCIPAAIFSVGCLYVFGSLYQLHGAPPSLRTYIGVLPMLGAINLTVQMLRIARLGGRLPGIEDTDSEPDASMKTTSFERHAIKEAIR